MMRRVSCVVDQELDDDPIVIAGNKYKNVSNPRSCIIIFIYSKLSVAFLCLIGCLTTLSTYLFTSQIAKSNGLCRVNDHLKADEDLWRESQPIRYYCRFLDLGVPINILQLLFCLAALFFALNRRSKMFFSCYILLGLSILVGCVLFLTLRILDYDCHVIPAVNSTLFAALEKDKSFCEVLEPMLPCKLRGQHDDDAIQTKCHQRRHLHLANDCVEYLTSYLSEHAWLIVLIVQYGFLLLIGLIIIIRSSIRFRNKKMSASRTPVDGSLSDNDNQQIVLANGN